MASGTFVAPGTTSITAGTCYEDTVTAGSTLLALETRLASPLGYPAIDQVRSTLLREVTTSNYVAAQTRTLLVLAYTTEIKSIFTGIMVYDPAILGVLLCQRRRVVDIDNSIRSRMSMFESSALAELRAIGIPPVHLALLHDHLTSTAFTHRVAAACAAVLLAALTAEV